MLRTLAMKISPGRAGREPRPACPVPRVLEAGCCSKHCLGRLSNPAAPSDETKSPPLLFEGTNTSGRTIDWSKSSKLSFLCKISIRRLISSRTGMSMSLQVPALFSVLFCR